jgi:hypothetical protein
MTIFRHIATKPTRKITLTNPRPRAAGSCQGEIGSPTGKCSSFLLNFAPYGHQTIKENEDFWPYGHKANKENHTFGQTNTENNTFWRYY